MRIGRIERMIDFIRFYIVHSSWAKWKMGRKNQAKRQGLIDLSTCCSHFLLKRKIASNRWGYGDDFTRKAAATRSAS